MPIGEGYNIKQKEPPKYYVGQHVKVNGRSKIIECKIIDVKEIFVTSQGINSWSYKVDKATGLERDYILEDSIYPLEVKQVEQPIEYTVKQGYVVEGFSEDTGKALITIEKIDSNRIRIGDRFCNACNANALIEKDNNKQFFLLKMGTPIVHLCQDCLNHLNVCTSEILKYDDSQNITAASIV